MNISTPEQMSSGTSMLEDLISKFEEQFVKEEKDLHFYHLVIVGEYNRQTCDKVEKIYSDGGWGKVKCSTSSEKRERNGLTELQLWRVYHRSNQKRK